MAKLVYLADVATLQLAEETCTGCGMCLVVCPHAVFALHRGKARIVARDSCMECGACARNCPSAAVSVQSGVGCAQAVLNTALGRTGAACCTLADPEEGKSSPPGGGPGASCC
jgi:NAD-dependent dihydropyrimidine dehydrogenase PreA subunit